MPLATNVRHSSAEQLLVAVDAVDGCSRSASGARGSRLPVPLRARRPRTSPAKTKNSYSTAAHGVSPAAVGPLALRAQHVARRHLDAALLRPPEVAEHHRHAVRCAARRSVVQVGDAGGVGPAVLLADLREALVHVLLVVVDEDRARDLDAVRRRRGTRGPGRASPSACPGGRESRSRRSRSIPSATAACSSERVSTGAGGTTVAGAASRRQLLAGGALGPKVDQKFHRRKPVPLDPVAQKMLDDFVASGRPNAHLLPVEQARANFEALFEGLRPGEDVAATADHEIPVAGGTIPARSTGPTDERGPRPGRLLPRRRLAARLARVARHDLPLAGQRVGRGGAERRLPAGAGGEVPDRRRRRLGGDRSGPRSTPPSSAPTRAGWPSRATRRAATWPP